MWLVCRFSREEYNPANNNRLTVPGGYTMSYDGAGNVTYDNYTGQGQGQRVYDAENRVTQAWGNNQWQTYAYDAGGQRVSRKVDGVETWLVYGMDGELVAEYPANAGVGSPQKEYGYRNGQLLVTAGAEESPNLAAGKTATQSSDEAGGVAGRAVDGNTSGNWANGSVSHTGLNAQAWWQVDLGGMQAVQSVQVWNRTDCCAERLTNFNVLLLDNNQTVVASTNVSGAAGTPTTVPVSGTARYVKVQLVGIGINMRAGLHTGECDMVDGKVGDIAAEIGAQIANKAAPDEVLVSSTVKDLVAGSGIKFEDRSVHRLGDVPGEWRLFAVDRGAKNETA